SGRSVRRGWISAPRQGRVAYGDSRPGLLFLSAELVPSSHRGLPCRASEGAGWRGRASARRRHGHHLLVGRIGGPTWQRDDLGSSDQELRAVLREGAELAKSDRPFLRAG